MDLSLNIFLQNAIPLGEILRREIVLVKGIARVPN